MSKEPAWIAARPDLLNDKMAAAIGRLIITWGALESALPLQVARLASTGPNADRTKLVTDRRVFPRVAMVCQGTDPKAALKQIYFFVNGVNRKLGAAVKTEVDRLLDCKARRDEFCHWVTTAGPGETKVTLQYLSAARAKPMQEKTYTLAQISGWAEKITDCSLSMDRHITALVGPLKELPPDA
jgi:hypothetical protein